MRKPLWSITILRVDGKEKKKSMRKAFECEESNPLPVSPHFVPLEVELTAH